MKKRLLGIIFAVVGLILAVPSGIFILSLIYHTLFAAPSGIGIIGGADGPTAVFLASSGIFVTPLIAAAGLIIGVAGIIVSAVLLYKKTYKEK